MCIYYTTKQPSYLRHVCVCFFVVGGGAHCYLKVSGTFHASSTSLMGKEALVSGG